MNEQKMTKFKVGERLKVRKDLVVDKLYSMDNNNANIADFFSERMEKHLGKEATVVAIENGKYKLDIDDIHLFTDGMLTKFVDVKAKSDYRITTQVEEVIAHVSKMIPEQLINHALDTGDKEMFMRLTKEFSKSVDKRL